MHADTSKTLLVFFSADVLMLLSASGTTKTTKRGGDDLCMFVVVCIVELTSVCVHGLCMPPRMQRLLMTGGEAATTRPVRSTNLRYGPRPPLTLATLSTLHDLVNRYQPGKSLLVVTTSSLNLAL